MGCRFVNVENRLFECFCECGGEANEEGGLYNARMALITLEYQSVGARRDWRVVVLIVMLALVVRVGALGVRGEWRVPGDVGAEAGVVARSIRGGAFSTPFDGPIITIIRVIEHWHQGAGNSPSTHLPPVYPGILAGFMWVQDTLGLPGSPSGMSPLVRARTDDEASVFYMALGLNLVASCLLPLVALMGARWVGWPRGVGVGAAVAMCFCPEALRAVGLVWDEALFALCAAALLYVVVHWLDRPEIPTWKSSAALGTLNGVLSLLNPAMVLALPAAWLVGVATGQARVRVLLGHAVLLGVMTIVGGAPWHVRNWFFLDPPAYVFVRGNFWLEVWTNINPIRWEDGQPLVMHPWYVNGIEPMQRDGHPLTEQQYFAWCKERVLASALFHDPGVMAGHVGRQVNGFWVGQAEAARWHRNQWVFFLAQGVPAMVGVLGIWVARKRMGVVVRNVLVTVLVAFPLPYYLAGGAARYRHPMDVVLYLGVGWAGYWVWRRVRGAGGEMTKDEATKDQAMTKE